MSLSRRALLGSMVAGGGFLAVGKSMGWEIANDRPAEAGRKPKNIIFCVVDGMPLSAMTVVDHLRILKEGKRSYWGWLYDQKVVHNGLQDTRSLNSVVTDSSAAASAWGSGRHIWNGMVNMFPDRTNLRTLTQIMSANKIRCGLVTTATITHATPAGFAVNCIQRDLEGLIAEEYLTSGVEILMGGGSKFFDAEKRADKLDLIAKYKTAGFDVVRNRGELKSTRFDKILGLFSESHIPYTVDRDNDPKLQETVPTLAEMASIAIDKLKDSRNGFLLQIEGARVDHGGHANDVAAMVYDQMAFEDAVKVAIDFAMKDGETLVIITADHACGGLALNGAGDEYGDSTAGLQTVLNMKASRAPVIAAIGLKQTTAHVQSVFEEKLGLKISADEASAIVSSLKGDHPFKSSSFMKSVNGTFGMITGNHSKATFTSGNHISDHVLVTAYGPGSEHCTGLTQNIEFFDLMLRMKDLKHENPRMSIDAARPLYEKLQKELNPELFAMYGTDDPCGCGVGFDHNYNLWVEQRAK